MYLVSYDIENDRLRLKLARTLIKRGLYRVQYSVFLGRVREPVFRKLRGDIEAMTHLPTWGSEDSIMILPLHEYTMTNKLVYGDPAVSWEQLAGKMHTLMF